ncbi:MAG: chemotaxis protein CheW [Herminiimonas sp.]|nr:chemotaxis protein CheW [Herminiimonas sp.]
MTSPSTETLPAIVRSSDRAGRRTRLREFQAQLVERMQAAQSGVDTHVNQLGVLIGETRWLLSLQEAGEIVSVGAMTPVPWTQDWFLGLTNIRGNLVSVVDLARFHGGAPTVIDKDCRVIAFAPALSFNCGLLVSRVMGLRNLDEMTLQEDPAAPESAAAGGRHYVDLEQLHWQHLDLATLVRDARFLHIAA